MTEVENLLITYRIGHRFDMKLAAAALARDWMDQASRGFANCCHLDAVMWLHRRLWCKFWKGDILLVVALSENEHFYAEH